MRRNLATVLAIACLNTVAFAAPQQFDFKDPKGVNNVVFTLDAPLEAISGSATGVSGTVTFDPENPASTKGKIVVAAPSLHVGNPMMKEHLHGEKWLNTSKNSEITFEVTELSNVKTQGEVTTAEVTGNFSLNGVTKKITVPAKLTYLKDKLGQRMPNAKGDLLVIRSNFSIKRSEFGINPGQNEDKVADTIELSLSIAGSSPR